MDITDLEQLEFTIGEHLIWNAVEKLTIECIIFLVMVFSEDAM